MAIAEHVVASTRGRVRSLVEPEQARWLWEHLPPALVGVLSFVLMPDHMHLVAVPGQWMRLRKVLAGFTGRFGVSFDLLEPQPANSPAIAGRMMRYGFFNAVRAGFVEDPWAWPLSTLRDLAGATYPVWTHLQDVAAALGMAPQSVLRASTATQDRAVLPLRRESVAFASLEVVTAAVAAALRVGPAEVLARPLGRRLAVQALHEISEPTPSRLSARLGCAASTVRRLRAPRHPGLDAVLTCLGDPRLRDGWGFSSAFRSTSGRPAV